MHSKARKILLSMFIFSYQTNQFVSPFAGTYKVHTIKKKMVVHFCTNSFAQFDFMFAGSLLNRWFSTECTCEYSINDTDKFKVVKAFLEFTR